MLLFLGPSFVRMRGSKSAPGLAAAPAAPAFEGRWVGGPHPDVVVTIHVESPSNNLLAHYTLPDGEQGTMDGRVQHGGTAAKCFWVDPVIDGAGKKHPNQMVELRMAPDGDTWTATAVTMGGKTFEWKAKRIFKAARRKGSKLDTRGWYRNKEVFDRLTRPKDVCLCRCFLRCVHVHLTRRSLPGVSDNRAAPQNVRNSHAGEPQGVRRAAERDARRHCAAVRRRPVRLEQVWSRGA